MATTSQPRSLLSIAKLNIARSRVRPLIWSFVRIDRTWLGRSGGFAAHSLGCIHLILHGQPRSVTRSIVVVIEAGWHARRSIFVAGIARRAGHTGGAARARMRTEPRLIRMVLAHPSAAITMDAFHRRSFRALTSPMRAARVLAEIGHSLMQDRPANSATPMLQAGQTGSELGFKLGVVDAACP